VDERSFAAAIHRPARKPRNLRLAAAARGAAQRCVASGGRGGDPRGDPRARGGDPHASHSHAPSAPMRPRGIAGQVARARGDAEGEGTARGAARSRACARDTSYTGPPGAIAEQRHAASCNRRCGAYARASRVRSPAQGANPRRACGTPRRRRASAAQAQLQRARCVCFQPARCHADDGQALRAGGVHVAREGTSSSDSLAPSQPGRDSPALAAPLLRGRCFQVTQGVYALLKPACTTRQAATTRTAASPPALAACFERVTPFYLRSTTAALLSVHA